MVYIASYPGSWGQPGYEANGASCSLMYTCHSLAVELGASPSPLSTPAPVPSHPVHGRPLPDQLGTDQTLDDGWCTLGGSEDQGKGWVRGRRRKGEEGGVSWGGRQREEGKGRRGVGAHVTPTYVWWSLRDRSPRHTPLSRHTYWTSPRSACLQSVWTQSRKEIDKDLPSLRTVTPTHKVVCF